MAVLLLTDCGSAGQKKLFTLLPPEKTGVDFSNDLTETDRFNIIKYLYFYDGAGVSVGDVNNDGLPDIFFTANQLSNRLFLNKGNFKFEDATRKAGLEDVGEGSNSWKTGTTMADVNADGWLDIYVNEVGFYKSVNGRNRLFINNKDGSFTEKAEEYGLAFKGFGQQASFFDYDLDGDLDLFLATHSVHSAESYAKADKRRVRDSMAGDRLYRNDGNSFQDVSEPAGIFGGPMGYALGLVTTDFNNDGWPDIFVTNDFHENDYLYLNNHDGTFTESSTTMLGHTSTFSMGADAADLNNDGLTDLMTLDMKPEDESVLKASVGADHYNLYQMKLDYGYYYQYPRNSLQLAVFQSAVGSEQLAVRNPKSEIRNPKSDNPHYQEIAEMAGVAATDWSWGTLLADLDNDGRKDIFITNGIWRRPNDLDYLNFASNEEVMRKATDQELAAKMPQGLVPNYAFQNLGGPLPAFKNRSADWGLDLTGSSQGSAYADFDNDGDLDLVVNNLNAPASMYRNNSEVFSKHNFLKIRLEGDAGNPFGVGAKVTVRTDDGSQVQEQSPVRGWLSSVDFVLNIGLGKNVTADEVKVTWPGGKVQTLTEVPANQTIALKFTDATEPAPAKSTTPQFFQPIEPAPPIFHQENRFIDFNIEPLMPHKLSTGGPKIAVGDVNGDGHDDFYLCGAKAQAGLLAVGRWPLAVGSQADFEEDFLCEDVDAVFFDADGDGDNDLFVVSGGAEYREGAEQLRSRLYLNDGQGHFTKSTTTAWPAVNGACAVPADFNNDGALDLFLGSRSVPGSYGLPPKSFIFLNDGKGSFREATAEICPTCGDLGMVTSAVWLPAERRLAVVGEWTGLSISDFGFRISEGKNRNPKSEIRNTQGWWNTLAAADMDGDGDLDLLAGNLGLNSNLTASPEQPLELFVKDFDGNGSTEPILTYFRQGRRYTVASKDEIVGQLQEMRKQYVGYAAFAKHTFEEIFDKNMLQGAVHRQAETFASTYFENLGDGNFKAVPLPPQAQVAPIHAFLPGDFDGDGKMDALAVGNFYGNQPFTGRSDALYGLLLKGDGAGNFTSVESGFFTTGECRDVKLLKSANGKQWVAVARNNDSVLFFEKE
ncbi:MAG: VCBS repeat-containing protein [Bacteroidetes bacterium]|nr:VCBS repeat-containing protein [Bacteroidota bacterium]